MVFKSLTPKAVSSTTRGAIKAYDEDTNDSIDGAGVTVDNVNYNTGGFLDRDYDVRLLRNLSIQVKNPGANSIDITILETTKDHLGTDASLIDADFTETGLAEVAVGAAGISAIYNLNREPGGKLAVTAVRLRAKETVGGSPGTVAANIKGF